MDNAIKEVKQAAVFCEVKKTGMCYYILHGYEVILWIYEAS
ncbi:hypothetical protein [Erysipelatoclostridium sp. DFI.2.3]|nr:MULTISPECIES: hypothetical protein [Thomasclavelia]